MQAQAVKRVVTITVFHVATNRMAHVSGMHANLVLSSRLQLKLHQRVVGSAVQHVEMGDSQFTTIIYG